MVLSNESLLNTIGGASSKNWGLGILFAALGSFLVGIVDGFIRPLSCNR